MHIHGTKFLIKDGLNEAAARRYIDDLKTPASENPWAGLHHSLLSPLRAGGSDCGPSSRDLMRAGPLQHVGRTYPCCPNAAAEQHLQEQPKSPLSSRWNPCRLSLGAITNIEASSKSTAFTARCVLPRRRRDQAVRSPLVRDTSARAYRIRRLPKSLYLLPCRARRGSAYSSPHHQRHSQAARIRARRG
jgi:hypothetical protein